MIRNRSLLTLAVLLLTPVALVGCGRKKPAIAPAAPDVAVTEPATPTVADPAESDPIENPLDGDLLAANEHAYATGLLGDIYFEFDLASLSEQARERLARNADFLRSHPEFVVRIEGHCDERGTNDYNLALGERRAHAARDYIAQLGIPAQRLRTVSYGEERPVCARSDESCWQSNRRAHFVLVERLGS